MPTRDVANVQAKAIGDKDFMRKGAPVEMPVMFGANFNDDPVLRQNLRRSHQLAQLPKIEGKAPREATVADYPHSKYDYTGREFKDTRFGFGGSTTSKASASGSASASARAAELAPPPPAPVLHFLGYFVENIPESSDEKIRVRKVAVSFHTEDDTVAVREARQENSGIVQANILSRQLVPKKDGSGGNVGIADLRIEGENGFVEVYGKKIHLVDCDAATRAYLRNEADGAGAAGAAVPDAALPWPDALDTYNQAVKDKMRVEARRILPTGDFEHRRAVESLLSGGVITKHPPDDVRTAQQFFANRINEKLTFFALYDDRARLSGDTHDVVIRYYLENDQIEIVSVKKENAGRDPGNKLLQRQRVPSTLIKQPPLGSVTTTHQQAPYGLVLKTDGQFLTYKELAVGASVTVFHKTYFIHDCDGFTRKWMAEKGYPMADAVDTADRRNPPPKQHAVRLPPHIGFGSDEDSLQSCRMLMVKAPKIDFAKRRRDAGKVLLFRAQFAESAAASAAEDVGREFLIRFFCDTDEIEIQERHVRNSGIVGGRFLAKSRYKKKLANGAEEYFNVDDFVVGGVVRIVGRNFLLTELDDKSRRMVEEGYDSTKASTIGGGASSSERIPQLIVALKEHLNAKFARAHEAFHFLCSTAGMITPGDIQRFFEQASGLITYDESVAIVNYFDTEGNGAVSFASFCRMMGFANSSNMDEASNNIRAVKNAGKADEVSMRRAMDRTAAVDAAVRAKHLRKAFVDKMVQRRGTVQEIFRVMCQHKPFALLTRESFRLSMRDVLHLVLADKDRDLLEEELFSRAKAERGLSLAEFSDFVEETP